MADGGRMEGGAAEGRRRKTMWDSTNTGLSVVTLSFVSGPLYFHNDIVLMLLGDLLVEK